MAKDNIEYKYSLIKQWIKNKYRNRNLSFRILGESILIFDCNKIIVNAIVYSKLKKDIKSKEKD